MPSYSDRSWRKLTSCHSDLIVVFDRVIEYFDHTILVGHRGEEEQNEAFETGHSHVRWPHSKHNQVPSLGVDVAPWYSLPPHIRWDDAERFYYLAGFVMCEAQSLREEGIITHRVRWGGDWDRDFEVRDQTFMDLGHFELIT